MSRHRAFVWLVAMLLTGCGEAGEQQFQGYMEADFLLVGAEEGGRVVALHVDEGSTVSPGSALFSLDAAPYVARRDEAAGRVAEARARLANQLAQQQRPEEIEILAARRRQAEAAQDLAAQELRRHRELFERGVIARSRLDQAQATFRESEAGLQEVQRQITAARLGGRVHEISAGRAAIEAAEAALAQAQLFVDRRTVPAPAGGIVQEVLYRPGEVVGAAQPILAILPADRLRVRFFVPEPFISGLRRDAPVTLSCDGCAPGMAARISFVSTRAEFTPPVIFGPTERAKLVFMVEAQPEGDARSLRPGQPITVLPGAVR